MTHTAPSQPAYRWVIVAAASIILAVSMGQLVNGLSVYFVPLEAEFGWDRGDIALINTAGLIGLAVGGVVMGRIADGMSVRKMAVWGVTVCGLASLAAARATELWQFYAIYALAGALGGGAIFAPVMATVGGWFLTGAGLAIGIASAGQALGQGGMPFTGAFLIDALGWRGALSVQGVVTIALLLPLALLLRDPPKPAGAAGVLSDETPSGLPNTLVSLWIGVAIIFCCICMSVPLMHLVPYIQGCGFSASEAGGVLFFMLMVAIAGRVAFGKIADLIGAVQAWLLASAWQTMLVFGFTFLARLDTLYLFAAVYGFGYAGVMTAVLVTTRTITAPARRASSLGMVGAFGWIGHGIGGWQGGYFFDLTGGYGWTFGVAAIAGVVNLTIVGALWLALNRRQGVPVFA